MLKTSAHSGGDSDFHRSLDSWVASEDSGMPFGPEMPAFATRRLMCFSFDEMSWTSLSNWSLDVTSQGPTLQDNDYLSLRVMSWTVTYGIISPASPGLWVFAAFSKTSIRRPVI